MGGFPSRLLVTRTCGFGLGFCLPIYLDALYSVGRSSWALLSFTFFADGLTGPALVLSLQGHPGNNTPSPGPEWIVRTHRQTAVSWQQDKQFRQEPSRGAPNIPLSAVWQLAQQVLFGGWSPFSHLHPEPHKGLGQAEEKAFTEQRSGWFSIPAPGAAHVTCSRGRAGGQVASNPHGIKAPAICPQLSWPQRG